MDTDASPKERIQMFLDWSTNSNTVRKHASSTLPPSLISPR